MFFGCQSLGAQTGEWASQTAWIRPFDENVSFKDHASGIQIPVCVKLAFNRKDDKGITICWHGVIVNFFVTRFLLSRLVTGPSFMSISLQFLELWQIFSIKDWPEILKSEIPPSEFFPISGDCADLGIPNFAQMSQMKCYWMLQEARVTGFTVFELSREN